VRLVWHGIRPIPSPSQPAKRGETNRLIPFAGGGENLARNVTGQIALTPETLQSVHSTPVATAVFVESPVRASASPSRLTSAGFVLFCVYLLSGFANDWSLRLFGFKAYVSTVTLALLPLVWLFSGTALRGFHTRAGHYWAAFLGWMLLAAPLSVWKGGSVAMLANYVPRAYFCFFYTCSFATTFGRCRRLMYVQAAAAGALLLSCAAFGGPGDDPAETRFRIPNSLFYANPNDLALALLIGICSFVFLLANRRVSIRLAAGAGILLASFFEFRTSSRGSMISATVLFGLLVWLSRQKLKTLGLSLAAAALIFVATTLGGSSGSALHRLSLLLNAQASQEPETAADVSSLASGQQRQQLFATSLRYTLAHPLFGVGPDQFAAAVEQDAARSGVHTPWLGTHNTYTQVSSECGIPALIFYVAVIAWCLRANYRLFLRTRYIPHRRELAALSRSLLAGTSVYAVSAFFFHMAYSAHLPMLAGFTVALQLQATPLERYRR
jgi:O-antigen ligase